MVTLIDVAARAGVSLGTASAAINKRASVKAATRERVERAAAELKYQKDASALVLASKRAKGKAGLKQLALGYVAAPREVGLAEKYAAFQQSARELGYGVELVRLTEYSTLKRAHEHLCFLNVQGLFLGLPESVPGPEWENFAWNNFAVVKAFRSWPTLRFAVVRHSAVDYMAAARNAVLTHGYRRIAVLLTRCKVPSNDVNRMGTILGYAQMHTEAGLEIEWRMVDEANQGKLPPDVVKWLRNYKPEALIAFPTSPLYHGVLAAGFKIPKDFAFAGVIEQEAFSRQYGVATCDAQWNLFSQQAVRMLHHMIQSGDRGPSVEPIQTVIEPRWLDGPSLPGLRSRYKPKR